jgi:hypothetical protein
MILICWRGGVVFREVLAGKSMERLFNEKTCFYLQKSKRPLA